MGSALVAKEEVAGMRPKGNALIAVAGAALLLAVAPGVASAQGVPIIQDESVSHITPTDATLEAHIDTEGVENGAWYQFQLATNTSEYAEELACPPEFFISLCIGVGSHSGALPIGFVEAGAPDQLVTHDLAIGGLTGVGVKLKPNTTYHYRVIAAKKKGPPGDITSWEPPTVFGPDQTFTTPAIAPSIKSESVSHITPDDATLEAHINTEGLQHGAYYQFQVQSDPSEYAPELACQPPLRSSLCLHLLLHEGALSIGFVASGASDQLVTLDLASGGGITGTAMTLKPGTAYHFRVIAANALPSIDTIDWEPPTVYGADQTFTTPAVAPSIGSESVSHITAHDATLEAHIGTEGLENGAYYQFQLAGNPSEYATELACPPELFSSRCIGVGRHVGALPIGVVAGGSAGQPVSIDLAGAGRRLKPDTTYHYRVIAAKRIPSEDTTSWEPPTVFGLDQTFITEKAHRPRKHHQR
jgi:hypothetical protein